MSKQRLFIFILLVCLVGMTSSSCTFVFQKGRRVDVEKISRLKNELSNIEQAKLALENRLNEEIADQEVQVEMVQDRGLVITFVAEVLFASGKADLKSNAISKIQKVADVLNNKVEDLRVGIEGHTDNVPIKYSGWKSNWELSTARALSVLHIFVDEGNVDAQRLSVIGYGEQRPIISNDTQEGRKKNRRVEIIIFPPDDLLKKVR